MRTLLLSPPTATAALRKPRLREGPADRPPYPWQEKHWELIESKFKLRAFHRGKLYAAHVPMPS